MDEGGGGRAESPVGVSSEGGGCSSTTGGSDAWVWLSVINDSHHSLLSAHQRSNLAVLRDEDKYPIIECLDQELGGDSRDIAAQLERVDRVLGLCSTGRWDLVRVLKERRHGGGGWLGWYRARH